MDNIGVIRSNIVIGGSYDYVATDTIANGNKCWMRIASVVGSGPKTIWTNCWIVDDRINDAATRSGRPLVVG